MVDKTEAFDIPWFLRQDPIKVGQEIIDKQQAEIARAINELKQVDEAECSLNAWNAICNAINILQE